MNILVTGGAGYIGSIVVEQLVETTEATVIVYDNLYQGHKEKVKDNLLKIQFTNKASQDSFYLDWIKAEIAYSDNHKLRLKNLKEWR